METDSSKVLAKPWAQAKPFPLMDVISHHGRDLSFSARARCMRALLEDKVPSCFHDAGQLLALSPLTQLVEEAGLAQCHCPWHRGKGLPRGMGSERTG